MRRLRSPTRIGEPPPVDLASLRPVFTPSGKVYDSGPRLASVVTVQAIKAGALIVRGQDGSVYFARQLAKGEAYRVPNLAGLTLDVSSPQDFQVFVAGQSRGVLPSTQVLASKLVTAVPTATPGAAPAPAAAPPATVAAAPPAKAPPRQDPCAEDRRAAAALSQVGIPAQRTIFPRHDHRSPYRRPPLARDRPSREPQDPRGRRRGGRRRADHRAVDDQHGHRRREGHDRAGAPAGGSRLRHRPRLVPDEDSTAAFREIARAAKVPLVADIHFHYKRGIEAAQAGAACLRINPATSATRRG